MPQTHKPTSSPILLVDDKPENLDILISYLEDAGQELAVALSGEEALELAKTLKPQLVLLDIMMPGMDGFETCQQLKASEETQETPIIFMSALSDTDSKVKGFDFGAVDFITKPLQREEVLARINTHLTIQRQRQLLLRQNEELRELNKTLQEEINQRALVESQLAQADEKLSALTEKEARQWGIHAFIGNSLATTHILEEVRNLQSVDKTNVLVLGESGTGKELVSRSIHFGSARGKQPFIAVNCSAIPAELADAEFFGHTKGAFTGATSSRPGFFQQADKGTLFLDEIGDMPLSLQTKLLRVLEDGLVTPVGSSTPVKVDVRVISATNIDLNERIEEQRFRQDLYYRLASYIISLPPLSKRKNDIPALAQHFIKELSSQMGREPVQITREAEQLLSSYNYPGNVRELKNIIENALICSRGQNLKPEHFRMLASFFQTDAVHDIGPDIDSTTFTDGKQKNDDETIILDYLKENKKINNNTAQTLLNIDHGRASYLLKKLHSEERIQKHGERRWAYYTLA